MPKSIIDEIGNVTYSVTSQNQSLQKTIPFSVVDLDTKYSEVTIPLTFDLDFANLRITINSNYSNSCSEESGFSGTDLAECQILEGEEEQEQDNETNGDNQDFVPESNSANDTNEVFNDENVGSEGNDGEGNDGEGNDGEGNDGEGNDGEGNDGEGNDGEGNEK